MIYLYTILLTYLYITNAHITQIFDLKTLDTNDILSTTNFDVTNNSYVCYSNISSLIYQSTDINITNYLHKCYKVILYNNYTCIRYNFVNQLQYNSNDKLASLANENCLSIYSFFKPTGKQCRQSFDPNGGGYYRIRSFTFEKIFGDSIQIDSTTFKDTFTYPDKSWWYYIFNAYYTFTKDFSLQAFIFHLLKYNYNSNITTTESYNFKNIGLIDKFIITDEICTPYFTTNIQQFKYFNQINKSLYNLNNLYPLIHIRFELIKN